MLFFGPKMKKLIFIFINFKTTGYLVFGFLIVKFCRFGRLTMKSQYLKKFEANKIKLCDATYKELTIQGQRLIVAGYPPTIRPILLLLFPHPELVSGKSVKFENKYFTDL